MQIKKEYANFLSKLNANDTLIAIADNNLYGIYKSTFLSYNLFFSYQIVKDEYKKVLCLVSIIFLCYLGLRFLFLLYYHPLLISSYL